MHVGARRLFLRSVLALGKETGSVCSSDSVTSGWIDHTDEDHVASVYYYRELGHMQYNCTIVMSPACRALPHRRRRVSIFTCNQRVNGSSSSYHEELLLSGRLKAPGLMTRRCAESGCGSCVGSMSFHLCCRCRRRRLCTRGCTRKQLHQKIYLHPRDGGLMVQGASLQLPFRD